MQTVPRKGYIGLAFLELLAQVLDEVRALQVRLLKSVGTLAVGGATQPSLRRALAWLIPVVAGILAAKLIKIFMWRPMLPQGASLGEGIPPLRTRLINLLLDTYLLRLVVAAAVLIVIHRIWFKRRPMWWVAAGVAAGYLATRIAAGIREGQFSLFGSWALQEAVREFAFCYALLRQDVIAIVALTWAVVWSVALASRAGIVIGRWPATLATTSLLLILGVDLAHFAKTGLNGTGDMLSFLLQNAAGTWFLIRSEVDWVVIACLVGPLLLAAFASLPAHTSQVAADSKASAWRFGLGLLLVTVFALSYAPPPPPPVYARFTGNTFTQLLNEAIVRRFNGIPAAEIQRLAEESPLLFDSRIMTTADTPPRRNVVVVLLESVRAMSTQLHDPRLSNTPFLAGLARQGAAVQSMYAVAPRTSAAWISIFYGIYPGDGDMFFYWGNLESERRRAVSLTDVLRSFGYSSAFFVPTHLKLQNDQQLIDNIGFDHVVTFDPDASQGVPQADRLDSTRFERINIFGLEDRALLEPIRAWTSQQVSRGRPFLLTVMTNAGHYPYKPPSHWQRNEQYPAGSDEYGDYLNSIAYLDEFIRDLYGILETLHATDNTIFIVMGDHGESFGEHGARQHFGQAYEEVLHVPAILHAPGLIAPGSQVAGLRQQTDLFPTILDLLDIRATAGRFAGRSLLESPDSDRALYFSGVYEDSTLGMRRGLLKFLYNFDRVPLEAYDLATDPAEKRNIIERYTPDQRQEFVREMLVWRASVNRALLHHHGEPPVREERR